MSRFRLSRRALLRGAGGIAVGLPFLDIMLREAPAAAQAAAQPPQRFLVFFSPDGSVRENWTPTGTETNFQLSRILAPLAPHKQRLIVLDGVDNESAKHGLGDDHMRGMGSMLTGIELLPGSTQGGAGDPAGLAGGISVDQKIAEKIGQNSKFRSLELGVHAQSAGTVWGYTSYAAAGQPLPPVNDPAALFSRVFADVGSGQTGLAKLAAERKSVLDAVAASYGALAPKLGSADKQKLDQHFTHIRELEQRLDAAAAPVGQACVKPGAPKTDISSNDNFPTVGKLQMDLLVMALACDLTRVGTLQWENSVGDVRFTWLGIDRGHHDMSHDSDSSTDTLEKLTQINVWYSQQLLYLMNALANIQEGTGTLLDNTLIFWCNELSRGNVHSHPEMPYLLAGGTAAAAKPLTLGRFLSYTGNVPHNNLLVSLLNVFGLSDTTFGNPAYCSGPLARL